MAHPQQLEERPRLLCLHGWRSNPSITALQLTNLCLDAEFDATHLKGPIETPPATPLLAAMSEERAFYAWVNNATDPDASRNELITSLKFVLQHLIDQQQTMGRCYDAVYGFSQGAFMATLLSCKTIRRGILREMKQESNILMEEPPWRFSILACSGNHQRAWTMLLGQQHNSPLNDSCEARDHDPILISDIPSVHIIGSLDPKKENSETIASKYNPTLTRIIYLENVGHEIPLAVARMKHVPQQIMEWYQSDHQHQITLLQKSNGGDCFEIIGWNSGFGILAMYLLRLAYQWGILIWNVTIALFRWRTKARDS